MAHKMSRGLVQAWTTKSETTGRDVQFAPRQRQTLWLLLLQHLDTVTCHGIHMSPSVTILMADTDTETVRLSYPCF